LSHEFVVQLIRVCLSRLELERAIVSSEVARETDQHLPKRGVDIEVELAFEVMGTEFAEAVQVTISKGHMQTGN